MNIKHVVEKFKDQPFHEWETIFNSNTMWMSNTDNKLKLKIKTDEEVFLISMYYFQRNEKNYRINIIDNSIEICSIELTGDYFESIEIHNYDEILSEDSFFQRSLLENMGDLELSNLETINNVAEALTKLYKDKFNVGT